MKITLEIKQGVHDQLCLMLEEKINDLKALMQDASESMKNDTKSSAGDKFETGREMMQLELNNKQLQLTNLLQLQKDLSKINTTKVHNQIGFGSLVLTSLGCYYISVALGAITLEGAKYYALSLASPIGKRLNELKVGDVADFQGKKIEILNIV